MTVAINRVIRSSLQNPMQKALQVSSQNSLGMIRIAIGYRTSVITNIKFSLSSDYRKSWKSPPIMLAGREKLGEGMMRTYKPPQSILRWNWKSEDMSKQDYLSENDRYSKDKMTNILDSYVDILKLQYYQGRNLRGWNHSAEPYTENCYAPTDRLSWTSSKGFSKCSTRTSFTWCLI